ncbi:MAG: sulfocyanin-like copper-binding protein [Gemmatimonadota bacterium]
MSRFAGISVGLLLSLGRAPVASAQLPDWISSDSAAKTVRLTLTATAGDVAGVGRLNGMQGGKVQIVVPLGWTVIWNYENADSTQNHSLVVMVEREKLPTEGGRPAFDNAMTRNLLAGLKPGQKDVTTFVADEAGWYWLLDGVPGHALRGEWLGLKIDREAKEVTVVEKK